MLQWNHMNTINQVSLTWNTVKYGYDNSTSHATFIVYAFITFSYIQMKGYKLLVRVGVGADPEKTCLLSSLALYKGCLIKL